MICNDMIVRAAYMTHSAVEGGLIRLIVRPERRGVYLFLIIYTFLKIILNHFFLGETKNIAETYSSSHLYVLFLHLLSLDTAVERGVYVMVPISTLRISWFSHHTLSPPHKNSRCNYIEPHN